MFKPATTPQPPEKVIQDSFDLFRAAWKPLSSLAFIIAFVSILPNVLIPELNAEDKDTLLIGAQKLSDYLLLYFMVIIIFHNALLIQLHRFMYGQPLQTFGKVIGEGFYKMLTVLLASVVFFFVVGAGLFLFILPGIWVGLRLFFYTPLIVVQDKNIIEGFQISFQLTDKQALATFQVMVIPVIAFFAGSIVLSVVASTLTGMGVATEGQTFDAVLLLLQFIITALMTPFLYAFMLVQLHNLQLYAGINTPVDNNDDDNDKDDKEFIA